MKARDISPRQPLPGVIASPHNLSNQQLIPIYTEWANRFLTRANLKPIRDLAAELCVPQTLVGLVHAVSGGDPQMSEVSLRLGRQYRQCTSRNFGAPLAETASSDFNIERGHLGAVLTLLYALSYFKQQQRAAQKFASKPETTKALTTNLKTTVCDSQPQHYNYSSVQSTSSGYSSGNYATVADLWENEIASTVVHHSSPKKFKEQQQLESTQLKEQQKQQQQKLVKAALKLPYTDNRPAGGAVKKVVAFKMPPNSSAPPAAVGANGETLLPTVSTGEPRLKLPTSAAAMSRFSSKRTNSELKPPTQLIAPTRIEPVGSSKSPLTAAVRQAGERQTSSEVPSANGTSKSQLPPRRLGTSTLPLQSTTQSAASSSRSRQENDNVDDLPPAQPPLTSVLPACFSGVSPPICDTSTSTASGLLSRRLAHPAAVGVVRSAVTSTVRSNPPEILSQTASKAAKSVLRPAEASKAEQSKVLPPGASAIKSPAGASNAEPRTRLASFAFAAEKPPLLAEKHKKTATSTVSTANRTALKTSSSRLITPAASKLSRLRSPSTYRLEPPAGELAADDNKATPEVRSQTNATGQRTSALPSSTLRTPSRIRGRTLATPPAVPGKSTPGSLSASQASCSSHSASSLLAGALSSGSHSSDASLSVQIASAKPPPSRMDSSSRLSRPKSRLATATAVRHGIPSTSSTHFDTALRNDGAVSENTDRRPTLAVKGIAAPKDRCPTASNLEKLSSQRSHASIKLQPSIAQKHPYPNSSVIGVVSPMLQKQCPTESETDGTATKTRVDALAQQRATSNASPQLPPPMAPTPVASSSAARYTKASKKSPAVSADMPLSPPSSRLRPSASVDGRETFVDNAQNEYDKEICRLTTTAPSPKRPHREAAALAAAARQYQSLDRQRRSAHYDSYEDSSSSISSGVSENLDDISTDDLTGSSSDFHAGFSPKMSATETRNRTATDLLQYERTSEAAPAVPSRRSFARLSGATRFGYSRHQKSYKEPAIYNNFDNVGDYDNLDGAEKRPTTAGETTYTRDDVIYRSPHNPIRLSQTNITTLDEPFYHSSGSQRYHTVHGALNLAETAAAIGVQQHPSTAQGSYAAPPRILSPPPTLQQHLSMLSADGDTLSCQLPRGSSDASSSTNSAATHSAASTVKDAATFRAAKLAAGALPSPTSNGYRRIQRGGLESDKSYAAMKYKQQQQQQYNIQRPQQLHQQQIRPQQRPPQQQHNSNGENSGYHTHSLDRHAHLKIFSLPSSSAGTSPRNFALATVRGAASQFQNGAGEGLISAPSSPYHRSAYEPTVYKYDGVGEDYTDLSVRHSVSASRKLSRHKSPGYASFRRNAAPSPDPLVRTLTGGNGSMSRSMILLHEGDNCSSDNCAGEIFDSDAEHRQILKRKEQLRQELEAGLRRGGASPNLARRAYGAPMSLAPFDRPPLDDSVYACRSESGAYSTQRNRNANGSFSGLQLHKLSLSGHATDTQLARSHSIRSSNDVGYIAFKKVNGLPISSIPSSGAPSPAHPAHITFATLDERYTYEVNKLNTEMEAYRKTISALTARHDGYNHLILTFSTRLQAMVKQLEKLKKTSHLKKGDAEKLRNEIEQLRLLSCTAGVALPPTNANSAEHLLRRQPSLETLMAQQQQQHLQQQCVIGAVHANGSVSATATPSKIAKASAVGSEKTRSMKKSSWIRSSFSRAFYKSNGKKSKLKGDPTGSDVEQSPLRCAVAGAAAAAVAAATAAGGSPVDEPADCYSPRDGSLMSTEALLKKQLEDKDLALTDVRLDALDKAREVDILRETIHRLKNENKILKHNFTVLEQRIRNDSRTSSQQSLAACCPDADNDSHAPAVDTAPSVLHISGASSRRAGSATTASSLKSVSLLSGNGGTAAGDAHFGADRSFSSTVSSKRSSSGLSIRVSLCIEYSGGRSAGDGRFAPPAASSCAESPISGPPPPLAARNSLTLSASHNQFHQPADVGRGLAAASTTCGSSCTIASTASSSSGCALSVASGGSNGSSGATSNETFDSRRELTIGYLPLPSTTSSHVSTWEEVDQQLGVLLENYLHRIDPDMSLGIANSFSSIIEYQLSGCGANGDETFVRERSTQQTASGATPCRDSDDFSDEGFNDPTERSQLNSSSDGGSVGGGQAPPQSPAQFLGSTSTIRLKLSGASQNSLDSLVLESLFPKSLLRQLINYLIQSHRLLIYGGTGIGKSNLARYLARYLTMRLRIDTKNIVDLHFPDDDRDQSRIQQSYDHLVTILKCSTASTQPHIIILDNIQRKRIDAISDAFASADAALVETGGSGNAPAPFVICTLNRTSDSPAQRLQSRHNFRLFALNSKMEAVKGYMGRYLRRRIAEEELSGLATRQNQFLHHQLHHSSRQYRHQEFNAVIEFLGHVLDIVNEFIENANAFDVTLGPRIFLQCPLQVDASRDWFVELWNEKIVPYMSKVARDSKNFLGARGLLKDPTLKLYEHWPWIDEEARGESLLLHVNLDPNSSVTIKMPPVLPGSHLSTNGTTARKSGGVDLPAACPPIPHNFDAIHALERIEENRG